MKKLKYLFAILIACLAISCTEEELHTNPPDDDDEPIIIGQPPKP